MLSSDLAGLESQRKHKIIRRYSFDLLLYILFRYGPFLFAMVFFAKLEISQLIVCARAARQDYARILSLDKDWLWMIVGHLL